MISSSRRLLIYATLVAVCGLGLLVRNWPVRPAEIAVYRTVLSEVGFEDRVLGVERRTALPKQARELPQLTGACFADVKPSSDLIAAFKTTNTLQRAIPGVFSKETDLALTNAHGLVGWLATRAVPSKQVPDCTDCGLANHLVFSRVGFSDDGRRALLFVEFHCALCGYGGFVMLNREAESWRLADKCTVWLS